MRLIFIRHAEPDYAHNTLTPRGFREAEILSDRIAGWQVDQFYASPLRRAELTAEPSLRRMNRSLHTLEWMREFAYAVTDPTSGRLQVPWDFMPQYWTNEPLLFDRDEFYRHPLLQSAEAYEPAVHSLRRGLDALLAEYGYFRKDSYYYTDDRRVLSDSDTNVVIFGHLGANMEAIGYLLGISPVVLQHSVFLAPTSICILAAEKRMTGDPEGWDPKNPESGFPGIAMFRAQVLGDVKHLLDAGQPVSGAGSFAPPFNG